MWLDSCLTSYKIYKKKIKIANHPIIIQIITGKKTGKKKNLFSVVNYTVLVLTVIAAVYIMANGLGLIDSLDFGAGAYYFADIPQFA